MARTTREDLKKKWMDRSIVIVIGALVAVAAAFGLFEKYDYRVYDALLGLHDDPPVCEEVLFLEADDDSLKEMGPWPWPRNIMGDVMLRLREFGAAFAVFDIEYLSRSQLFVDNEATKNLKEKIALKGDVDHGEVQRFFENKVIDADRYFAQALQFFGNAWLTINILDISEEGEKEKDYAKKRALRSFVTDPDERTYADNRYNEKDNIAERVHEAAIENIEYKDAYDDLAHGFSPAIHEFLSHSAGAGYTNVDIDSDGTRRRIQLLNRYPEGYAAQLVFSPLLKKIDAKGIERDGSWIIVKDAKISEESGRRDIKIPLDEHGRMLINWKHGGFSQSFKHQKIVHLYYLEIDENRLSSYLLELSSSIKEMLEILDSTDSDEEELMELAMILEEVYLGENGVAELIDMYHGENGILKFKNALLEKCEGFDENGQPINGGISEDEYKEYFALRKDYFKKFGELLGSQALASLCQMDDRFVEVVKELDYYLDDYNRISDKIAPDYKDAFCIVGNTGSATTDLGTTPFNRRYPNIGTHGNVYNTIVNQDFIIPVNWLYGILLAFAISYLLVIVSESKNVAVINFSGFAGLVLVSGGYSALMIFFGIYVPLVGPALMVLVSFIVMEILHFVRSEKDKSFLKHAFATYLNPKSVDELMAHPERLSLGGDQKHLTALFSDIKSFSTFSEKVTPIKLVNVLKTYLGNMSDCILQSGGTIDKYIGDSIVSFFGAPAELENSAWSACVAAIRMKQAEVVYNKENLENGFIPEGLKTRIGINTGEMVVGNMGTDKKFNYTVMGSDVNLASRLEGVNKVYKSWILCTEYTWNEANVGENIGKIVARKFDRVRVVGIDRPVQIYNILGFKDEMTKKQLESVDVFEQAMSCYLAKDFEEAKSLFDEATRLYPEDESASVYAERCSEYAKKGVSDNWDGVLTMKTK